LILCRWRLKGATGFFRASVFPSAVRIQAGKAARRILFLVVDVIGVTHYFVFESKLLPASLIWRILSKSAALLKSLEIFRVPGPNKTVLPLELVVAEKSIKVH